MYSGRFLSMSLSRRRSPLEMAESESVRTNGNVVLSVRSGGGDVSSNSRLGRCGK